MPSFTLSVVMDLGVSVSSTLRVIVVKYARVHVSQFCNIHSDRWLDRGQVRRERP